MATTQRKPRKQKKPRQGYLDGLEPPRVPAIEKAADDYVEARDARMQMLDEEVNCKAKLHELLKKHELKRYDYDGRIVEVKPGEETVKVRKKSTKEAAAEENGQVEVSDEKE